MKKQNKQTENNPVSEKRGLGRPAGSPNKVTRSVKEMILKALDEAGGTDYLLLQAKENPVAFLSLLGRIMPTQVVGEVRHEFIARLPEIEKDAQAWLTKYAPPQKLPITIDHESQQ